MAQVNTLFNQALAEYLGHEGSLVDLTVEFLILQTGSSSTNINDLWLEFAESLGETEGSINDRLFNYFEGQGLSGSYNDKFLKALVGGLPFAAAYLQEDGYALLQEDGSSLYLLEVDGGEGFCAGFGGVICQDGSDASDWTDAAPGSLTSNGTEFVATMNGSDYAGYILVDTVASQEYLVTLELTSTVASNFYAEAYTSDQDLIEYLEPMNNEIGLTPGIYTGSFTATTSSSLLLFGEFGGSVFTFKNFKVEAV